MFARDANEVGLSGVASVRAGSTAAMCDCTCNPSVYRNRTGLAVQSSQNPLFKRRLVRWRLIKDRGIEQGVLRRDNFL